MSNAEHKQKMAAVFNKASEGYDSPTLDYFIKSALHMVEDMRLQGNERMLDVATGTGHVALAAASELTDGSVTGVDISGGMLERACKKADALNIRNVTFKCCDLEEMGFPDNTFDVASCAFGLFFLPDMENGLKCISKVLIPGGRLHLTSFRTSFMEPMRGMLMGRLKSYGIEPPVFSTMRLDTPEKIEEPLLATGYSDIYIQARQLGYYIKDAQAWMDILWNTAFRGPLGQLSENDLERFTEEHTREVDGLRKDDGIWLDIEVLYTKAVKPILT